MPPLSTRVRGHLPWAVLPTPFPSLTFHLPELNPNVAVDICNKENVICERKHEAVRGPGEQADCPSPKSQLKSTKITYRLLEEKCYFFQKVGFFPREAYY